MDIHLDGSMLGSQSYIDEISRQQAPYMQQFGMENMVDELSWPCQFMSPNHISTSPSYPSLLPPKAMNYPTSPGSLDHVLDEEASMLNPCQTYQQHQHRHYYPYQNTTTTMFLSKSSSSSRTSPSSPSSSSSPPPPSRNSTASTTPKPSRERRKAQNRASQRAYRERKEMQLRDLAARVAETERAMTSARTEKKALDESLERMRKEMERLRSENDALRRGEKVISGPNLLEAEQSHEEKEAKEVHVEVEGKGILTPTPQEPQQQHPDEGSEEEGEDGSRSTTASEVATPKDGMDVEVDVGLGVDIDLAMDGIDWDAVLVDDSAGSKQQRQQRQQHRFTSTLTATPSMGDGTEDVVW